MKNEKDARARLHQVYGSSLKCVEFSNKEGKYDRFVCSICTNYSFLSYLSCENCRKSGCSEHISICICDKSKMTLFERYTNEELQGFMSILDDEIKRA